MSDLIRKSEYGKSIALKIEMIGAKIDNCRNSILAQSAMNDWASEIKGLYDALIILDDTPSVDAVEVVHGQWIWVKDHWECSICRGSRFTHDIMLGLDAAYCSRCGAKMDEVTHEET